MYNLAIVILNFNGLNDTLNCIDTLKKLGWPANSLFVVDNCSTDGSRAELKTHSKQSEFIFIEVQENNGYAAGNNIGIQAAIAAKYKYICVMNPDVKVETNVFLSLAKILEENSDIGLVGPCIRSETTKNIISCGGQIHYYSGNSRFNMNGHRYTPQGLLECDYLSGALIVFRSSDIKKVGLIPEEYFLNYEDNEWAVKFSKAGFKIICNTDIYVFHEGESSIDQIDGMQYYFMSRNRVLFERRNAPTLAKVVFYLKLVLLSFKHIIFNRDFITMSYYLDGFTEKNRFKK